MNRDNSGLGHVPRLTIEDLEHNIGELEARLGALNADDSEEGTAAARLIETLLRNRRNLIELMKGGRFA